MKELISNLRKKIISEIKESVDKNSLEELKINKVYGIGKRKSKT